MGNEFGHPEWIDFPRAGNNWSYQYCRRQWSLADSSNLKYHYLGSFDRMMLELVKEFHMFESPEIYLLHQNKPNQVLAFKRGDLLFVFNFNPNRSYKDYGIQTEPGKYSIVLDTDSVLFGGSGNVDEAMTYYTSSLDNKPMINNYLKVYIPARSGLVFRKIPSKRVYDL
jgi:1,4-alpha-glucan branching enzyme